MSRRADPQPRSASLSVDHPVGPSWTVQGHQGSGPGTPPNHAQEGTRSCPTPSPELESQPVEAGSADTQAAWPREGLAHGTRIWGPPFLISTVGGGEHGSYPHFTAEETEAPRSSVTAWDHDQSPGMLTPRPLPIPGEEGDALPVSTAHPTPPSACVQPVSTRNPRGAKGSRAARTGGLVSAPPGRMPTPATSWGSELPRALSDGGSRWAGIYHERLQGCHVESRTPLGRCRVGP